MRIASFIYHQIILKIALPLIIIICLLLWCFTTTAGLRTSIQFAKTFIPGQLSIQTIKGTLWTRIELQNLHWNHPDFTFKAHELSFNPNIVLTLLNRLYLDNITLEEGSLILSNLPSPALLKPVEINMHFSTILFAPLIGKGQLKTIRPRNGFFSIENQVFKWVTNIAEDLNIHWTFSSKALEQLSIESEGVLNLQYPDNVQGTINQLKFSIHSRGLDKKLIFSNIDIREFNLKKLLQDHSLSGVINAKIEQLNAISALFPAIARPAGEISANLTLKGYLQNPELLIRATLNNGKFYLPKERIKINNIYMLLTGNLLEELQLNGFGNAGAESFTLKGSASPFLANSPNQLNLTGKNLQLHDTANMFIVASPDIQLNYHNHAFFLTGSIEIPKGAIIQRNHKNIVRSDDVIFVEPIHPEKSLSTIGFYPNIQFTIDEGFRYIDNKMDIILKGNIQVEKREDGLYAGNGRLTIVEGQYQLDSGTQYIRKGRLLFVPGTLLKDPLLDIKMAPKSNLEQKVSTENNIYVYGTLKKPIVQLFETNQKTFETLSKLGVSTHASHVDSQKRLEAHLLNSGTHRYFPFIETLQKNIGLEFGFETTNLNSPLSQSTRVLVITKPLSDNFSFQFLQGLPEKNTKNIWSARLKYSLNENFDALLEHGTEGTGGGLSFSMECD